MRQLFNKSGTIMVFFANTFFLCTFLISMFLNARSSDIYTQFSQEAEYLVIQQDHTEPYALSYRDVMKFLSSCHAKGVLFFDMDMGQTGYALFNYHDDSNFSGIYSLIDINNENPQMMIKPEYQEYCMTVDGKQIINFMGVDYEVKGLDIYSGNSGADFICNISGWSESNVKFQGLSLIVDADENTRTAISEFISNFSDPYMERIKISDLSGGIGGDKLSIVIVILLIGLLLLLNSGVFANSWIHSKKNEIAARRICGADDLDIKRIVFIEYFVVCLTGTAVGVFVTYFLTAFTGISYYLGRIEPTIGFVSTVFFLLVSGVISYEQSSKYSKQQIAVLRRE